MDQSWMTDRLDGWMWKQDEEEDIEQPQFHLTKPLRSFITLTNKQPPLPLPPPTAPLPVTTSPTPSR